MGSRQATRDDFRAPEPVQPNYTPHVAQRIADATGESVVPILTAHGPSWAAESTVKDWPTTEAASNFQGLFEGYRVEPGLFTAVFDGVLYVHDLVSVAFREDF